MAVAEVIVEIGNAHEGSLGIACSMVDMAKAAGVKTVKFQMHLPEYESTEEEPFRVKFSLQDETRMDYWARVGFNFKEWRQLIDYVEWQGMEFLCTPFSIEAATWLFENHLVKRWKVGSGDATNFPLVDFLVETHLPLIISTGLISELELAILCKRLESLGALERTTLLHCVSKYPVDLDETSLHLMEDLRFYSKRVGYSDHSGNLATPILAMALGADLIEVHMTPHPAFFGPDTKASLTPEQIKSLLEFSKSFEIIQSKKKKKDDIFESVRETAKIFRKGIYWKSNLNAGTVIQLSHLSFKKPIGSIDSIEVDTVVGKIINSDVISGRAVLRSEISD